MDRWEGFVSFEESEGEGSNELISDPGTSAQPKADDNFGLDKPSSSVRKPRKSSSPVRKPRKSSSPVRKPRKSSSPVRKHRKSSSSVRKPPKPKPEPLHPMEKWIRRKNRLRKLIHSCPLPSRTYDENLELVRNDVHGHWQYPVDPRKKRWNDFKKCCSRSYNIKNSVWFIYIFQFLITLLCVSSIIMGSIFFHSCEGSFPLADPILNILMGLSGLLFVYKWLVKVRRQRREEDFYKNSEKHKFVLCLVVSLIFMGLGYYFFTQTSAKTLQPAAKVQCTKIYYDYMYYMYITCAVFLALAIFFHIQDCCIYAWIWGYLRYQRLDFPSATRNYRSTGFLNHEFDFDADFE